LQVIVEKFAFELCVCALSVPYNFFEGIES